MKPLRVFDINMHHHWGGQPNRVLTYNKRLAKRGHEVVVAGPKGCLLCRRAAEAGLEIFDDLELRRGFRPASQLRDYRRLKRLFRERQFDIVHTHGSQDTWLAALAAKKQRPPIPVVRSRHNTFPIAAHPLNRWLYGRMIDWVITISPQVNDYLTESGLFPAKRITSIYSAPDEERFRPELDGGPCRLEFEIPADAPVIGMVGRLAPEKGHADLIEAVARIVGDFPDLRVVLVGTGRSEPEIRANIERLGLQKHFILTGFRTDVPELVAMFDIFTLTPISGESLGTSILEGFLMEKPAVATDVGGVRQSVRDGETGFLAPPHAPERLADCYLRLLRDPELGRKMGRRGREMVLAEFGADALAEQTEQLYFRLLGRGASS
jgi:glycosyltransferase involved in cell wall biosynthesis